MAFFIWAAEPASKSKGGYKGVDMTEPRKLIMEILSDGVSIMAVDEANGNKVVGIRTSYTVDRLLSNFGTGSDVAYGLTQVVPVADRNCPSTSRRRRSTWLSTRCTSPF